MKQAYQANLENDVEDNSYLEKQTRCGMWGYYPSFLQPLASKKTYIVVFGVIGMLNYALGSYQICTLSTLEKRFKIPSKTSGLIMSFWDIGTLLSSVSMAYIGGQGHKTRWVALGIVVSSLASFAQLLPHVIYGPGEDAIAIATASYNNVTTVNRTADSLSLCGPGSLEVEDCSEGSQTSMPALIIMMSNLVMGCGSCMYWTLGAAYLDDNVKKDKAALLLSISVVIRMLGPTFGNLLASYALQLYIDPSLTPKITTSDPRWTGAWWFGWVIFGFLSLFFAVALALFPRQLPRVAERKKAIFNIMSSEGKDNIERSMKDFISALKRLAKNKILMYNIFSSVFYMFGFMAYWVFLPKYIETQFQLTASQASLITGSVSLACTAVGVIVSGAFISKYKPQPRTIAAWNVFTEALDAICTMGYGLIQCPKQDLHGDWNSDGTWNLYSACNSACNCGPEVKYEPVCAWDKSMTYYSPCHAGCTDTAIVNGTKMYTNCSCIPGSGTAIESFCPVDCNNEFMTFLALLCIVNFFGATGRTGNTIIQFRAVAERDKSVSIGLAEMMYCALTFIPSPLVYGAILDYTCLVWGHTCGKTGNCWLYFDKSLRHLLNFTSSGFISVAVVIDCFVWYHVKNLKIYDDELEKDKCDERQIDEETEKPMLDNTVL